MFAPSVKKERERSLVEGKSSLESRGRRCLILFGTEFSHLISAPLLLLIIVPSIHNDRTSPAPIINNDRLSPLINNETFLSF